MRNASVGRERDQRLHATRRTSAVERAPAEGPWSSMTRPGAAASSRGVPVPGREGPREGAERRRMSVRRPLARGVARRRARRRRRRGRRGRRPRSRTRAVLVDLDDPEKLDLARGAASCRSEASKSTPGQARAVSPRVARGCIVEPGERISNTKRRVVEVPAAIELEANHPAPVQPPGVPARSPRRRAPSRAPPTHSRGGPTHRVAAFSNRAAGAAVVSSSKRASASASRSASKYSM